MSTETSLARKFGIGFEIESFTVVHWAAILLAAVTGVVHLYLFWNEGWPPFLLGGLGFFGAIVLLLFNVFRKWLYALGIPYTLAHIAGWLARGMPNFRLGEFDKTVQVLLISCSPTSSSRSTGLKRPGDCRPP